MKQRIVILSAFLSPMRSGAEACVEEMPLHLVERFHFTIVTARLRRDLPRDDLLKGVIPVVRIGTGTRIDKWLFPFLAPLAASRLKPDIVHAVLESFAGLALVLCRFIIPRAKRLLTCQSTNTRLFLKLMHRCAHRITVISSALRARASSLGRDDTVLIPNGIPLPAIREALRKTDKEPGRVLFVGRLERMKGVDVLLHAYARVREHLPDARTKLVVVGDGSQAHELHMLADRLRLADLVSFPGKLPPADVLREYAKAEIFVGLSFSEALGNVFLEAQAAGCAVLATDVGGIPDIVHHGVTGILVPPGDDQKAAEEIERLLLDEALRNDLAARAVEHAQAYDWKRIAEQYGEVYDGLR